MNFNLFFLILLMLSANFFFECSFLGDSLEQIYKFVFYAVFLLVSILAFIKKVNNKKIDHRSIKGQQVIDKCIIILLFGLFVSLLNSFLFKEQSLLQCIITNIPMLIAYLSYFVFKKMNLTDVDEKNIIIFMAITYCIVYILSVITLPNPLFGSFEFDEDRGGFRFRIKGLLWVNLCFFFLVGKYKYTGKKSLIVGALILGFFIAASLTRQVILWTTVLGIAFLMINTKRRKKLLVIIVVILLGVFVVPEIPLVKNLTELSEMQKEQNDRDDENVRIKDYRIFLYDYDRNLFQYVFGCGAASRGNSKYGKELDYMTDSEGIIPEDVSLAGSVLYYGYFSTFIMLFMFYYSIFRIRGDYYKRFYLLYIALCAITSGVLLYFFQVIITMFVLSNISRSEQDSRCVNSKAMDYCISV